MKKKTRKTKVQKTCKMVNYEWEENKKTCMLTNNQLVCEGNKKDKKDCPIWS